ncbi:DUF5672 family protein [Parabacteroides sp. AM08-6]|uniref:DUF5672 family protein n=1 Tax=Parabacteroides sp. AM08-6 TaxID=2292053 RepID=UPI000EFDD70C|nr:DUF5672 family protein [Parabacteroides sp. AM08-6]RHJ79744.1 hypothetical protein DW103_13265 [Parabacteroides sp. AM08-6]
MKIAILIPIYKELLSDNEVLSLSKCLKILYRYKIFLVAPYNLEITEYKTIFDKYNIPVNVKYFDNCFFENIEGYNSLMLNISFYTTFSSYEYILIYQLDAYVFSDQLEMWCKEGYDYIGAPWFDSKTALSAFCGNGGFSLRKVDSFILSLSSKEHNVLTWKGVLTHIRNRGVLHKVVYLFYFLFGGNTISGHIRINKKNEDLFFSSLAFKRRNPFRIPTVEKAALFSFEMYPSYLFELTNHNLPFGCHAWDKWEYDIFWKKYIK